MFKKILIISLFSLFLTFIFTRSVLAEKISIPFWGPIMSCNTQRIENSIAGKYSDPCSSLCDLISTAQRAIYLGITFALFIFAPLIFLIGSFLIILSRGNQKKIEEGKNMLKNTAWGVAIILLAFVIVNTFFVLLGPKISDGKYNWSEIECPSNLPGTVNWQ
ncbi:MAG: pilin [Patescibacteria group bacterium]|nr:pilin [Patescibacteria group bacterium]MCX7589614.1 pilin [Patescibacteria group bacterium]MDW8279613.1 pilin [bacterium]